MPMQISISNSIGGGGGNLGSGGSSFENLYSFAFDGSLDYINIPSYTTLDGLDKFTVSVWVKMPKGGGGGLMGKNNSGSYNAQRFKYILSLTAVQIYVNNITFSASLSLSEDTWYNIIWNFDRTIPGNFDKSRVLINNVDVTNTNGGNTQPIVPDTDPFTIGSVFRGTSSPIILSAFEGNIDEVSIWNTALSDPEMTSIYNNGTPNDVSDLGISGLVNWYRMGDKATFSTNWTLEDQGSEGNNGTTVSMPVGARQTDVPT